MPIFAPLDSPLLCCCVMPVVLLLVVFAADDVVLDDGVAGDVELVAAKL